MTRQTGRVKQQAQSRETNHPAHWIGPRWLGIYRNSKDSRLFVRRSRPFIGWGLNHAHPMARLIIAVIVAMILVGLLLAVTLGRSS